MQYPYPCTDTWIYPWIIHRYPLRCPKYPIFACFLGVFDFMCMEYWLNCLEIKRNIVQNIEESMQSIFWQF
jgi:hypothetical protein